MDIWNYDWYPYEIYTADGYKNFHAHREETDRGHAWDAQSSTYGASDGLKSRLLDCSRILERPTDQPGVAEVKGRRPRPMDSLLEGYWVQSQEWQILRYDERIVELHLGRYE